METPPAPNRDERVSLAGPDPLDVLRAMLKVDPDSPTVDDEPPACPTAREADTSNS